GINSVPAPVTNAESPVQASPASHDSTMIGRSENDNPTHAHENGDAQNTPPQRLKAKPKRPSAFTNEPYNRDNYHSQAG
ncbi:MAG: hypothetical protein O7G85_03620, partial [Planctomycetota bacterium]|nr:hypothetical protein [Planctomycetota bacterium]